MIRVAPLALIVACYSSPASLCSDGRACSAGLVCDDTLGCIFPQQRTDCDGKPQGASCSYPTQPSGVCDHGLCIPSGCGNGLVEPELGEVCDDGTVVGGDGCSADCTSLETCGNGVVDGAVGEQCDDGNALSHDGCSSACRIETPQWLAHIHTVDSLSARLAYDPTRRLAVGFGPNSNGTPTTIWDGVAQTAIESSNPLASRAGAAFARDGLRHQMVSFVNNDTLIWEGKDWRAAVSAHAPPTRQDATATWDGARGVVVLFGGTGPSGALGDTWTWDGRDWTLAAASGPPPHAKATMACDPRRALCVLEDGTQTWEWDGATWTMRGTGPDQTVALVYDSRRAVIVAIVADGETSEWNGASWTSFAAIGAAVGGAIYDDERGVLFAFNNLIATANQYRRDGTTWSVVSAPAPLVTVDSLAYDRDRGNVVVEGPTTGVWNGTILVPTTTDNTTNAVVAETASGVVRFGGSPARGTFTWDGNAWHPVTTNDPVQRDHAAAAADKTGNMIMFGGTDQSMQPLGDVWRFDGATWSSLPSGPSVRFAPYMTYDARRAVVVAVGPGEDDAGPADVWEWDGSAWHQSAALIAGQLGPLAYDLDRGVVVMGTPLGTWQYDGVAWTSIAAPVTVTGLAFDAARARTLAVTSNGAKTFAWDSNDADEACLSGRDADHDGKIGCDDPDCWPYCTPSCPPGVACDPTRPRCGDGVCNTALENCRSCPGDCGACPALCGDDFCDAGEDHASCPGDCP